MSAADTGTPSVAPTEGSHTLDLTIGGMTCASCAARIEKKLNRVDGVTARVNYATEKARVTFPASLDPERLVSAVGATRDTAPAPPPPSEPEEPGEPGPGAETAGLSHGPW